MPLFMKQLGSNVIQGGERRIKKDRKGGDMHEWPHELRVREFPQEFHDDRKYAGVNDRENLKWPPDRPRTRFQDRKPQNAWKLNYADTLAALEREMRLSKVTYAMVTHNQTGHEDAGVAVWMSRKPMDDYAWQDEFGFIGEIPTVQDLDRAYMQKAKKVRARLADAEH